MSMKAVISGALIGLAAGAMISTVYPVPMSSASMRNMRRAIRRGAKYTYHKMIP